MVKTLHGKYLDSVGNVGAYFHCVFSVRSGFKSAIYFSCNFHHCTCVVENKGK